MKVDGYSWEGLLLFRYIDQIQLLGKADLNKMNTFSDKFQRNDARTIVKLFIAQGFLKEEKKDENEKVIRREFRQRSFKRSFTIDEKIDATNIDANYVNGVLTLNLPKKEEVKASATEITIK